jgi:quercetin dioxygenase-like cupin family protein
MEIGMFDSLHALRPYAIWDGAVARAVHGEQLTMAVVELQPEVAVPEHRHVNEQLGFVTRGSITMTIGGESRELGVGETYVIATDVPHAAVAGPEGATVVDVFSPPRSDWEGLERLEPSRAAWP